MVEMAFLLVESVSYLLLLASVTRAQYGQVMPNSFFVSGSEGPCGFSARGLLQPAQPVGPLMGNQGPPVNAPHQGLSRQPAGLPPQHGRFVRQAVGPNTKPAFNPQPQPQQQPISTAQRNANQPSFNPALPAGPGSPWMNPADILGLPAGMTINQAHHLEIDARNPYDLDVPEPGAAGYNPAMNVPATGRGVGMPHNLPATYPYNQAAANSLNPPPASGRFGAAPQPDPYAAFPGTAGGSFPYALRMNCQCDNAGDCNSQATFLGVRFKHECRGNLVCCCRTR